VFRIRLQSDTFIGMNDQTPQRPVPDQMTVDQYLPWVQAQGGRWELIDGRPVKMASETVFHVKVKAYVWLAISDAIEASGRELHALTDGATVRIDPRNANEPDCLVYAGPERPGEDIEVPDPVIVAEVVSPTSGKRDKVAKRADYFSLPSVVHYLIVDPVERTVQHIRRTDPLSSTGQLLREGESVDLAPLGIVIEARRFFARR
jgi:Uma2 family endonuclease